MSAIPIMTLAEFHAALAAQGVPRGHEAVKCPACGTVQSFADLHAAHAAADPVLLRGYFGEDAKPEDAFAHSCIGRYERAGAPRLSGGCNWTLGGFLQVHRLIVEFPDGTRLPAFEPATPQEALAHYGGRSGDASQVR